MIIDVHTHIFPPQVMADRERFCQGEPAFAAIYQNPDAPMVDAEGLVGAMDGEGVDISWAVGFPWIREENARLHNDYLQQAIQAHPKRLRGLACVHPPADWAMREAERSLGLGLHGLGELAFYDSDLDTASLGAMCDLAAEADAPLLLHTNEPVGHQYPGKAPMTLAALYGLITAHPATKLVLAHMGGGLFFYAALKREVSDALAKVWLDTAAAPFLYRPRAYGLAVELMGEDKLLMGSDYPLLPVSRYRREIGSPEAGLSPEQLALALGDNAARLLA
ncbi:MAG: amidohydrolase [Desulfarculaceae bacterium]|nr:amidohydrolase [Desulfarculaceae bacterium]MCF8072087.1 amidohydrolase [Desulfarculaceae bacterium]MCF8101604.1 amidohydrolase [Desulfarculaceae bacterium]MCF8115154.1 amidohydrolase [Desulfarculaceae bacterium]